MLYYYEVRIKKYIIRIIQQIKFEIHYYLRKANEWYKGLQVKRTQINPLVLQLPVTYKCNFDCAMCGMRGLISNKDYTSEEFERIIQDPIYQTITSVGINGGEPFLRRDLLELIKKLLTLPNVKVFYFISNGYFTERILKQLEEIKKMCHVKNVRVSVAFSVDGVDDMQDLMRGHEDAFKNVSMTCKKIIENKDRYCDEISIISTITKINIARIYEVQEWADSMGLEVAYNIATIHERINNEEKYNDFSVFTDDYARHLAMEFFYSLFLKSKSQRYFAIYYFLRYQKRIAYCDYQHKSLTLIPNGNIAYCATHSKELGNVIEKSTAEVYMSNLGYQKKIMKEYCGTCSHYMYDLTAEGLKLYYDELLRLAQ